MYRIHGIPAIFVGNVLTVEERGLWITSGTMVHELRQDKAWGPIIAEMSAPEIFVPFPSLTYLIAPKRKDEEQQQTPYVDPDEGEIYDRE
jgi:hypothetical protein